MTFRFTRSDRCIRAGNKIVGRVYQDADTKLFQGRCDGVVGGWFTNDSDAFQDAVAKKNGYASAYDQDNAIRIQNAEVRRANAAARNVTQNFVMTMTGDAPAVQKIAAMDRFFDALT
jgi:hypothetical protein